MLSVADALEAVLANSAPLPAETVPLADAHGRVLTADLVAQRTQPPADVSAMDGYAVRAADVARSPLAARSIARSVRARPHAFSPAGWCRPAPTPWLFRRSPRARATMSW